MTRKSHKSTEGIGIGEVRRDKPADEFGGSADWYEAEPAVTIPEVDEDHDSNTAKIALGITAFGLVGLATAAAYRNLRKQHKEGK